MIHAVLPDDTNICEIQPVFFNYLILKVENLLDYTAFVSSIQLLIK